LDHTHIVASITNCSGTFLRIFFNQLHNLCFLSGGASTTYNSGSFTRNL
jgi:hypothetical protein